MDCPHIPIIPYHEFSKRIHGKALSERIPLNGSIEPTLRCNLKCAHCYVAYDHNEKEMTYEEMCRILDEIAEAGCVWLLITGGEPLIRDDFLDVYTYAKKKGLIVSIFTNGTLITPLIADYLKEWRPFAVEVTLYGRTRQTYERVTGIPGSYERCMRGIKLLLERNLPLKLKSVIMTLNRHEVWDMKAYAEEMGMDFRFDPVLNLQLDGGQRPAKYRLLPEDVVALELADEKWVEAWREFCDRFWGPPSKPAYLYQCSAGVNSFHIDPYGQLSACMISRVPSYNLRRGTFREGWDEFMPRVRAQKWTEEVSCKTCELIALCGQCPGWARLESGDQQMPVPYLCRIAHLRAEAFGFNNKK